MKLPLISPLCGQQAAEAALNGSSARKAPRGEAFNIGDFLNFKRFVIVRYETGDARPPKGRLEIRQKFQYILSRHFVPLSPQGKARIMLLFQRNNVVVYGLTAEMEIYVAIGIFFADLRGKRGGIFFRNAFAVVQRNHLVRILFHFVE